MVSPFIEKDKFCFKFYFQLKPNEGVKTLMVLVENNDLLREQRVVWQFSDPKLDFWEEGQVYIDNPTEFRVST